MSLLKPPYAAWAESMLGLEVEAEPRSTCSNCPCAGVTMPALSKCCSSPATVPNFLVGRVLDVPSVAARITNRHGVSPTGLGNPLPSTVQVQLLNPLSSMCPHYQPDGGHCAIYEARPALCATYFCRYERASRSHHAWNTLRDALMTVEPQLALWAARDAGLDAAALRRLLLPTDQRLPVGADPVSDAEWAARWGNFAGRETELYAHCADAVAALSWEQCLSIAGVGASVLGDAARLAFEGLRDRSVPERLQVQPHTVVGLSGGAVALGTFSLHQPIHVSTQLHGALGAFDGRRTEEAQRAIAEEHGIQLTDDDLVALVDAALLMASPSHSPET